VQQLDITGFTIQTYVQLFLSIKIILKSLKIIF